MYIEIYDVVKSVYIVNLFSPLKGLFIYLFFFQFYLDTCCAREWAQRYVNIMVLEYV